MALNTAGRVRTATGLAFISSLILVLVFGSPAYTHWAAHHASSNNGGGYFLRALAWPQWSFDSNESIRNLLSTDLRAILVVVLTVVFVSLLPGLGVEGFKGTVSQLLSGWGGYIFAGGFAGLLSAGIASHASLVGAFNDAAAGVGYGLFVGWIVGLVTLASR